jgi:RND family efflux transporter MFP subunit
MSAMRRGPLLLAFALLAAAGCDRRDMTGAMPPAPVDRPAPRPVSTPASSRPAPPDRAGWIGVVVARESVDVTAESQGRLRAVHVAIGDRVRRGDPIATLDTSLAAQDLEMARSALTGAEADERRATAEFGEAEARSQRRQNNPEIFSKEDLSEAALQAKTAAAILERARSQVAEQRARVRQLETSLARNEIRAPFEGRIAERFVDPGALVGPGTSVVRLISAGDLLVRAAVPPEAARRLAVGDPLVATVRGLHLQVAGTLQRIAPEVDAASQMVLVEVRLAPTPAVKARLQTGLVVDVAPRQQAAR